MKVGSPVIHSWFPDFTLWIGWNVCFWHIATVLCEAPIRSLSEA